MCNFQSFIHNSHRFSILNHEHIEWSACGFIIINVCTWWNYVTWFLIILLYFVINNGNRNVETSTNPFISGIILNCYCVKLIICASMYVVYFHRVTIQVEALEQYLCPKQKKERLVYFPMVMFVIPYKVHANWSDLYFCGSNWVCDYRFQNVVPSIAHCFMGFTTHKRKTNWSLQRKL